MGRLISYINIYNLFECQHYIIRFLSSSCQLSFRQLTATKTTKFSSSEVKYDRFRKRDEGARQKPLEILSTKECRSELLTYITDVVQPEETSRWKSINTHTQQYYEFTLAHKFKSTLCSMPYILTFRII